VLIYLYHRVLHIAVPADLSQAGVKHVTNMKRLRALHLIYLSDAANRNLQDCFPDFIVTLAGEVPSLRDFKFPGRQKHDYFIKQFTGKYPQKELLVKFIVYV
jgi:hypothetical protein